MRNNKLALLAPIVFVLSVSPATNAKELVSKEVLENLDKNNALYLEEKRKHSAYIAEAIRIAGGYGYNHGYVSEMKALKQQMLNSKSHWDRLLSFKSLSSLLSDGAAQGMYLIGGIVDEVDASIKTVDNSLLVKEGKKFTLRQYPSLAVSPPYWLHILFPTEKIDLAIPAQSILPRTPEERELWKMAVDKGWERGVHAARNQFRTRYKALFADLIGTANYWYLVETGVISSVTVGTTNYYLQHQQLDDTEVLTLNPTSISINSKGGFIAKPQQWDAITVGKELINPREELRDHIVEGNTDLQEVLNSDVTILTPQHEKLLEGLKSEAYEHFRDY